MEMEAIERLAAVEVRKEYTDITGAIKDLSGLEGWIDQRNTRDLRRRSDKVTGAALKKIRDAKRKDKQLIKMTRTMERNYDKLGKPHPEMPERYERTLMKYLEYAKRDIENAKAAIRNRESSNRDKAGGPRASYWIMHAIGALRDALTLARFIHKQWYLSNSLLEQSKRTN